jgi:hypothetical protein
MLPVNYDAWRNGDGVRSHIFAAVRMTSLFPPSAFEYDYSMFLQNVAIHLGVYTAPIPRSSSHQCRRRHKTDICDKVIRQLCETADLIMSEQTPQNKEIREEPKAYFPTAQIPMNLVPLILYLSKGR